MDDTNGKQLLRGLTRFGDVDATGWFADACRTSWHVSRTEPIEPGRSSTARPTWSGGGTVFASVSQADPFPSKVVIVASVGSHWQRQH